MGSRKFLFTRFTAPLIAVAVIIVLAGAFHFFSQIHLMQDRAIQSAEKFSESLTRVIDDQVNRSIQSLAIIANNIAGSITTSGETPDLRARLEQLPSLPELRGLLFVRPDFSIVATSLDASTMGNYVGSPEYRAIAGHLASHEHAALASATRVTYSIGTVIGRPVGSVEWTSPPFIPVSRPVRSASGSLIGYLVAMVNVPYLELQHRSLTAPHGARVYIATYEGMLLATTSTNFSAGDNWAVGNPIFTQFLPQTERGTFRGDIESNRKQDIVSFRVIRDWPIVVAVSIAESVALAEWKEYSIQSGVRLVATILILLIGLVLLGRYLAEIERKDVALARQGATLQNTLDHMSDGLVAFNSEGAVVAANARLMGMIATPEAAPGDVRSFMWRLRKVIGRRAADRKNAAFRRLWGVLRGTAGSAELSTRSGNTLEVRSSTTPDGGRILLVNDVTKRREQEEAIRRSESEKNAIIVSALDCIIVSDSKGLIREFNPAAERTFGWSKEGVIGRDLFETILPAGAREEFRRSMEPYLAPGGHDVIGQRIEISALRQNGDEFPCELAITRINDGRETFFTAYLRDISARKEAESEVMAAREAAEQASRVKSEFLAHISHEIRTPMNAIVGYSSLALEGGAGDDQRQYAEGIAEAARSLLTLVNDVLDLSRLEAGRMSVLEERFSLHRVLDQIVDTARILTREKEIEVLLVCDVPDGARFLGDPDRIRQVLLNLVGNATKFTERGAIRISVRSKSKGANADIIEMEVADTGMGISDDAKSHIFEPFEQDRSSGRQRLPGTGLGLAISRSLARMMGGDISFESTLGQGSTFTLSLLLKRAPAEETDVLAPARKFTGDASRLKILIAEDTPASQLIMKRMLEQRGFTVVVANDGEEAIRVAVKERPDAILMDVQMPVLDGMDATRRLRAMGDVFAGTPIVALTAQAFSSDRELCRAAGMTDFIAKPVFPDLLDEALARVFSRAGEPGGDKGEGAANAPPRATQSAPVSIVA
ncbi:MAG: PAS domain S-box protein [Beijerinckiaceae bacterium]|nr:PAS domain S-box protein [Beijerinckiaceae bacterium]